eukprot:TRINITY_DN9740_c0_g1_i1.p2 TRINITY_DN9740_c0_g1~~TRINITY_DN9740_c0_g1_i1.p2  ORF type:complete len:233 (+),score=56.74 TRINITY_DN9740_c0_g1_i1:144-842(+)
MVLGQVQAKIKDVDTKFKAWVAKQPAAVDVAVTTISSALQGGAIGALMGSMSPDVSTMPQGNLSTEAAASMQQMKAIAGGPLAQARNFAVMAGVNAGIHCAMKRARNGADDYQNSMVAGFGSGAVFSLVSGVGGAGQNPAMNAMATGMSFAMIQGLFTVLGDKFGGKPPADDPQYYQTKGMLRQLGLQKYEKNFRKGYLNDATLPLLNDSALRDINIPPGPRLLILDHVTRR